MPGRRTPRGRRPADCLRLFQEFGRPPEREPRLFESVYNLLDGRFLVVKGDSCDVGIRIDFRFIRLCHVQEGPTDPLLGEGSLAVRQQELYNPFLGYCGRCSHQNDEHNRYQHENA